MKSGMLAAEAMCVHFPLPALENCDNFVQLRCSRGRITVVSH